MFVCIPSYTEQPLQVDGETVGDIDPFVNGSACTSGPLTHGILYDRILHIDHRIMHKSVHHKSRFTVSNCSQLLHAMSLTT